MKSLLTLVEVGEASRNRVVDVKEHEAIVSRQAEIVFTIQVWHTGDNIVLVFPVDGADEHEIRDVFRGYDASRKPIHRRLDHDTAFSFQPLLVGDEVAHGIIEHDRLPC